MKYSLSAFLERGKSSGRTDDTDADKIRTRFEEYNEKTAPLVAYYSAQGKYEEVNGIGEIEAISAPTFGYYRTLDDRR